MTTACLRSCSRYSTLSYTCRNSQASFNELPSDRRSNCNRVSRSVNSISHVAPRLSFSPLPSRSPLFLFFSPFHLRWPRRVRTHSILRFTTRSSPVNLPARSGWCQGSVSDSRRRERLVVKRKEAEPRVTFGFSHFRPRSTLSSPLPAPGDV